ncbi:MAG TPA: hypothetical protein VF510_01110 [Ktedonobacterales bacterium]
MDVSFDVVSLAIAIVLATATVVAGYRVWMQRSRLLEPLTVNTGLLTLSRDVRWQLVWTVMFGLATIWDVLNLLDGVHWARWRALLAESFAALLLLYIVTSLIIWRRSRTH